MTFYTDTLKNKIYYIISIQSTAEFFTNVAIFEFSGMYKV